MVIYFADLKELGLVAWLFLYGDCVSRSVHYYAEDIAHPSFVLNPDSTISVPTGPELGVKVNQRNLERFTVKRETFDA